MPCYQLDNELWFPPVEAAEEYGLLAVGGDLSPEFLERSEIHRPVRGVRRGIIGAVRKIGQIGGPAAPDGLPGTIALVDAGEGIARIDPEHRLPGVCHVEHPAEARRRVDPRKLVVPLPGDVFEAAAVGEDRGPEGLHRPGGQSVDPFGLGTEDQRRRQVGITREDGQGTVGHDLQPYPVSRREEQGIAFQRHAEPSWLVGESIQ